MKKLFPLFVAALFYTAMFADTKTIYCQVTHNWWTHDDAAVSVHYWGGSSEGTTFPGVRWAALPGENGVWVGEIPTDVDGFCFARVNREGNLEYWNAKTVDLTIQDGKNLFVIADNEQWDPNLCTGDWGEFSPAKFFIAGILGDWAPNAIKSTVDEYTVNVTAGHHALKVTNGTWDVVKGLAQISEANKYLYPDQDGNVCFFLSEDADVKVTYIAGDPETFNVTSEKFELPTIKISGAGEKFGDWDVTKAIEFEPATDELSASKTFTLSKDEHVYFRIIRAGELLTVEGEGGTDYGLNRDWHSVSDFFRYEDGKKCVDLTADADGDYVFTWIYATGTINVTFPSTTGIDNVNANTNAVKRIVNGQLVIEKNGVLYNALGAEVR